MTLLEAMEQLAKDKEQWSLSQELPIMPAKRWLEVREILKRLSEQAHTEFVLGALRDGLEGWLDVEIDRLGGFGEILDKYTQNF